MAKPGARVGVIYGDVASTEFHVAVASPGVRRLDYVETEHQGARVLGIVDAVTRKDAVGFDEALEGDAGTGSARAGRLSAHVHVIGFRDARGRVQVPRSPFAAGAPVTIADEELVTSVLGLAPAQGGALLGHVKGLDVPVRLDLNVLAQKHVSVLAKTGAGKSYTVGVLLEEFLEAGVPMVILDPHGEYGALRHPNVDERDMPAMVRCGIKPKSFNEQVREFAVDTRLNRDAEPLRLEGVNLSAREIVDLIPGKLSGGQVGVLYQAVKDLAEHHPAYTLEEVIEAVQANKSSAKWNVVNALEALQASKLFHVRGTAVDELVKPRQCSIINLRGVGPDIQEIVAARVASMLWEARKRDDVPPHLLVVEEAHHFCPERGVGNAVSGPVLRTVASEGRKFGLGLVIVSQRPAKIDKNVVSQCNTQFVLKLTNPNDLRAIASSVESITAQTADEVQRLPVGVALVAGGGLTQPVFVEVRPRRTRHGGASIAIVEPPPPKDAPANGASGPPTAVAAQEGHAQPAVDATQVDGAQPTVDAVQAEDVPDVAGAHEEDSDDRDADDADDTASMRPEDDLISIDGADLKPVPIPRRLSRRVRRPMAPPPDRRADARRPGADDAYAARPSSGEAARTAAAGKGRAPSELRLTDEAAGKVHRVATRVGTAVGEDPRQTEVLLQDLSQRQGLPPDAMARQYLEIARAACHADVPACIRCPLRDDCLYHASLQEERQKQRGGLRRLWHRR